MAEFKTYSMKAGEVNHKWILVDVAGVPGGVVGPDYTVLVVIAQRHPEREIPGELACYAQIVVRTESRLVDPVVPVGESVGLPVPEEVFISGVGRYADKLFR